MSKPKNGLSNKGLTRLMVTPVLITIILCVPLVAFTSYHFTSRYWENIVDEAETEVAKANRAVRQANTLIGELRSDRATLERNLEQSQRNESAQRKRADDLDGKLNRCNTKVANCERDLSGCAADLLAEQSWNRELRTEIAVNTRRKEQELARRDSIHRDEMKQSASREAILLGHVASLTDEVKEYHGAEEYQGIGSSLATLFGRSAPSDQGKVLQLTSTASINRVNANRRSAVVKRITWSTAVSNLIARLIWFVLTPGVVLPIIWKHWIRR